jgi:hypothetical protein
MNPNKPTPGLLQQYLAGRKSNFIALFCLGLAVLLITLPECLCAQGDLMIMPRRVIFEKGKRIQELALSNTGKDSAKYLISTMEIRMKEDGSFEQIYQPDSGQQFASKYLRIFPRSVFIPPGGSQVVKVELVRAEALAPGEYRSHIYFRAVPVQKPLGEPEEVKDSTSISIKLVAVYGISIPALVRIGENDTRITLTAPSLVKSKKDGAPQLKITFNRSGQMSSYGDLTVSCISADGKSTQVGIAKGIAVYTPNKKRDFVLDLDNTQHVEYHACKLHVVYKPDGATATEEVAEADLIVP